MRDVLRGRGLFEDIADWARVNEPWLRRLLKLKKGTPSHDTFRRVSALLDPKAVESAFRNGVGSVVTAFGQIAIDGKSLRRSAPNEAGTRHLVSIDAMGTQREIVPAIVSRKVDHLLAVKNNQPSLRAPSRTPTRSARTTP